MGEILETFIRKKNSLGKDLEIGMLATHLSHEEIGWRSQ